MNIQNPGREVVMHQSGTIAPSVRQNISDANDPRGFWILELAKQSAVLGQYANTPVPPTEPMETFWCSRAIGECGSRPKMIDTVDGRISPRVPSHFTLRFLDTTGTV